MAYDESPVYRDPPSNEWFGFQVWSVERVAEVYYVTGDARAKAILEPWIAWAMKSTKLTADGGYTVPSSLAWSGQPGAPSNGGLHVRVVSTSSDVGSAAGLAKVLAFYAAKSGDAPARTLARELLDRMWTKYRDAKGVSAPEVRADYARFNDRVAVPAGFKGKMPNGDPIDASSTFIGLRSKYKKDPEWPRVEAYLRGGPAPRFTYHRFWAEAEVALANATYAWLFERAK
jgi:hypothetical protein